MGKYSINFIIPYFGKFPNYFQLFLNSCRKNSDVNWTIITDNTINYEYPNNVQLIHRTFENEKRRISNLFDFDISLNEPYKFCDFKPAYGFIFKEFIEGYDFWGYCDVDIIFGDIRKFIKDEILAEYSKLFTLGNFTLVKNIKNCNTMFKQSTLYKDYYKKVFSSPKSFNFDESFLGKININTFFSEKGYEIYRNDGCIADIYTKSTNFRLATQSQDETKVLVEKPSKSLFIYDKGKLFRYIKNNNLLVKKEYLYIHLQKRRMKNSVKNSNRFIIIPNSFEDIDYEITLDNYDFIPKKRFNNQYFHIRYNNLKTKLSKLLGFSIF